MHEMSLMSSLLRGAEARIRELGGGRVRSIRIAVGLLSGAEPDLLEIAFEELKRGTVCEGARLTIRRPPLKIRCCGCEQIHEVEQFLLACPTCGARDIEVEGGDELLIEEMEVDFGDKENPRLREDPQGQ